MEKNGIILLFLSDYKHGAEMSEYTSSRGEIMGEQTNDAPMRFLIREAICNGVTDLKILCIVSQKVYGENISGESTGNEGKNAALLRLEQMAGDEIQNRIKFQVAPLYYDFAMVDDINEKMEREKIPGYLFGQIVNIVRDEKSEAYVDYTGGMRDISFLLVALIRYLEFKSIQCRKIVYSDYNNKKIVELNYVYDIFRIVEGLNEFATTGNAHSLGETFAERKMGLISSIMDFSKNLSLCRVSHVSEELLLIADEIRKLEETETGGSEEELHLDMLISMLPLFREKMLLDKIIPSGAGKIQYPYLIQWCLNNRMIQQALTLYVEKMPIYYIESGIVSYDANIEISSKLGSSPECTFFYEYLYDGYYKDEKKIYLEYLKEVTLKSQQEDGSYERDVFLSNLGKKEEFHEMDRILSAEIRRYYNKYGKANVIVSEKGLSNTFKGVVNSMNNGKLLPEISDRFATGTGTYGKKISALDKIEKDKPAGYQDLFKRMQYYLAVKFIRNNINHAATQGEYSDDEKLLLYYLKEHGIISGNTIDYETICEVVEMGIRMEMTV